MVHRANVHVVKLHLVQWHGTQKTTCSRYNRRKKLIANCKHFPRIGDVWYYWNIVLCIAAKNIMIHVRYSIMVKNHMYEIQQEEETNSQLQTFSKNRDVWYYWNIVLCIAVKNIMIHVRYSIMVKNHMYEIQQEEETNSQLQTFSKNRDVWYYWNIVLCIAAKNIMIHVRYSIMVKNHMYEIQQEEETNSQLQTFSKNRDVWYYWNIVLCIAVKNIMIYMYVRYSIMVKNNNWNTCTYKM